MGDRSDPPRLCRRWPLRHHRPHRGGQDDTSRRHLPGPVRPHAAPGQGHQKRKRDHVPPHGGLLRRGHLRDPGRPLPLPLEPASGAPQARWRAPASPARDRRPGFRHPDRDQYQWCRRAGRSRHRHGFRPLHPLHAAGPGRLRRLPPGPCRPAGTHPGADHRHGDLQPDLHPRP